MKQLQDMTVMEAILSHKIIAIIRGFSREEILRTAEALLKGGIRLMEVTFDYAGILVQRPRPSELCAGLLAAKCSLAPEPS